MSKIKIKSGFGYLIVYIVHAMEINVAIELAKLISNKFSENLKKIIIINPTFYIQIIHKMILPFLNNKVKDIIEINYETKCVEEIIKMIE